MKNILRLTIDKYHFAIQEELNDKVSLKALKGNQEIKSTKLYSIVQTNRMYINLDSFCIDINYNISLSIHINNKIKVIKFNLMEYYFELHKESFENLDSFINYLETQVMKIEYFEKNTISKNEIYKFINILRDYSYSSVICLKCPFDYILSNCEYDAVFFNIYRILNYFNIKDIRDDLEIIYIGKSLNDTLQRLKTHEKWSEVQTKDRKNPNNNYDYLVYMFNFRQDDIDFTDILTPIKDSKYNIEDIVDNLETALISYYKPMLNDKKIDIDFPNSAFVKKELKDKGYDGLIIYKDMKDNTLMADIKTSHMQEEKVDIFLSI
ncbi:hypothetical protein [Arcobacter sp.]|uniref:hypothetical protein n=1 Tax=Arcobacter sp. TaxID=1872629 RepID=UPI003D122047